MKKDNKGFSLVELIIVIAIMAILVGIVGSQVLPYLNKSREAKDQQILSGWVTSALSAYSANAASLTAGSYQISIPCTGGTTSTATCSDTVLANAFNELATPAGTKFASKTYQSINTPIVILVTPAGANGKNGETGLVVQVQTCTTTTGSIDTRELVAK